MKKILIAAGLVLCGVAIGPVISEATSVYESWKLDKKQAKLDKLVQAEIDEEKAVLDGLIEQMNAKSDEQSSGDVRTIRFERDDMTFRTVMEAKFDSTMRAIKSDTYKDEKTDAYCNSGMFGHLIELGFVIEEKYVRPNGDDAGVFTITNCY